MTPIRPRMRPLALSAAVAAALAGLASAPAQAQPAQRPNILVIMADDIGYANVGIYSHGMMVPTPNIDRIGREGILFTDHYGHPSSTAGRAGFITGQLPIRTGMTTVGLPGSPVGIDQRDPTLGKILKELGYRTAQFGLFLGVQVVQVAVELIETVDRGQVLVAVAQMVLAELPGAIAEFLEDPAERGIALVDAHR